MRIDWLACGRCLCDWNASSCEDNLHFNSLYFSAGVKNGQAWATVGQRLLHQSRKLNVYEKTDLWPSLPLYYVFRAHKISGVA